MMSTRIEGYIANDLYIKLDNIRTETEQKGFSKILNHIINKYFMNIQQQNLVSDKLNKVIQGYEDRIKNLQLELREKKKSHKKKRENKEKK